MILIILTGCSTVSKGNSLRTEHIAMPSYPLMLDVQFKKNENGFSLTVQDTKNLDINLERLNTYIKSLEAIIDGYRGQNADYR